VTHLYKVVIFDQIVVKYSPGLISPSFSGQFFITRVTATPGFKILDGHVHYQSLDKTDNMSDCQLTIKETRYSTLIKLRNVQFLKITRLAESNPIFCLKWSETMILCWNWFVYSWKFYWMSDKNISCEFQIFWNFDQKRPFEQFKTHQNYNLTRDQSFFRVGLHMTEQNAYCIGASDFERVALLF